MSWLVKYLGSILLVLAAFTVCYGQEKPEPNRDRIELKPTASIDFDAPSILENLSSLTPPPEPHNFLLNELAPKRPTPGEIRLRYDGLEGVIISRILSYHRRYWSETLNDRFSKGYISLFQFEQLQYERMCAENEAQLEGQWWDRSWNESLPHDKGGAGPTRVVTIGRELNIFEFGEMSVTNTGQIRLGSLLFYIYKANIDPKMPTSANSVASGLIRQKEVSITDYINLTVRPRVTIKASLHPEDILSNVSCEFRFKFYSSYSKHPWGSLTVDAESSPMKGIASLRKYLMISEFDFDHELDAWRGPNGLVIADQFITDLDDYHTSRAVDQLAEAVESGAKKVTAHVISTRPTRICVEWI